MEIVTSFSAAVHYDVFTSARACVPVFYAENNSFSRVARFYSLRTYVRSKTFIPSNARVCACVRFVPKSLSYFISTAARFCSLSLPSESVSVVHPNVPARDSSFPLPHPENTHITLGRPGPVCGCGESTVHVVILWRVRACALARRVLL